MCTYSAKNKNWVSAKVAVLKGRWIKTNSKVNQVKVNSFHYSVHKHGFSLRPSVSYLHLASERSPWPATAVPLSPVPGTRRLIAADKYRRRHTPVWSRGKERDSALVMKKDLKLNRWRLASQVTLVKQASLFASALYCQCFLVPVLKLGGGEKWSKGLVVIETDWGKGKGLQPFTPSF